MDTLRVGIVGLTGIAAASAPAGPSEVFASEMPHSHAAGYAVTPHTQVVAVCDLVPDLCQAFRAHWASAWGAIAAYADYREMLARERLDAFCSISKHTTVPFELELLCERGRICLSTGLTEVESSVAGSSPAVRRLSCPQVVRGDTAAAIAELVSLIEKGDAEQYSPRAGQCPPREARKAVEIIMAILASQHRGSVRVDLPLEDVGPQGGGL